MSGEKSETGYPAVPEQGICPAPAEQVQREGGVGQVEQSGEESDPRGDSGGPARQVRLDDIGDRQSQKAVRAAFS